MYVFAVRMNNSAAEARFAFDGLDGISVNVIGEDRSIMMTHGFFEDSFAGYGVHIYQLPTR